MQVFNQLLYCCFWDTMNSECTYLPNQHEIEESQHCINGHALYKSAVIPPSRMLHLEVIPQSLLSIEWGITSTWALRSLQEPPAWWKLTMLLGVIDGIENTHFQLNKVIQKVNFKCSIQETTNLAARPGRAGVHGEERGRTGALRVSNLEHVRLWF